MEHIEKGLFELEDGTGHLLVNKCERCNTSFFPRRKVCNKCFKSDRLKDYKINKAGTLYTYSKVLQSKPTFKTPYIIAYIDFKEEGLRVFSQLTNCENKDLKIGMKMKLVFEPLKMKDNSKNRMTFKFAPM